MNGNPPGSATMDELSPGGDDAWAQRDSLQNGDTCQPVADDDSEALRRSRHSSLLPDIPSLPTFRGRAADGAFVLFLLVSRYCFLIGAVVGAMSAGFLGAVVGLAGGWIIGVWMRWSLGLRRRGLTHGFVVRMLERGNSDRPKLLEFVVETLRGRRLSAKQCRSVAAAYALATRRLQTCDSPADRAEILRERDRKVLEAIHGRRPSKPPLPHADELVLQRINLLTHQRSGQRAVRKCRSERNEARK